MATTTRQIPRAVMHRANMVLNFILGSSFLEAQGAYVFLAQISAQREPNWTVSIAQMNRRILLAHCFLSDSSTNHGRSKCGYQDGETSHGIELRGNQSRVNTRLCQDQRELS